ncbi:hypothetical protein C8Q79DRAFT_1008332 [Trametes meyenii]|nr:hypothetical protein C8Q79DRAFT_1008332 [Trametes meyenii]
MCPSLLPWALLQSQFLQGPPVTRTEGPAHEAGSIDPAIFPPTSHPTQGNVLAPAFIVSDDVQHSHLGLRTSGLALSVDRQHAMSPPLARCSRTFGTSVVRLHYLLRRMRSAPSLPASPATAGHGNAKLAAASYGSHDAHE